MGTDPYAVVDREPTSVYEGIMTTEQFLRNLMKRYTTDHLVGITPELFEAKIREFIAIDNYEMEGYESPDMQRDVSVKFHWGHNHDFGTFQLEGQAKDRHIELLTKFIDDFGLPRDLSGKRVMDVGVWSGGTTLLLFAMGAHVTGIEEVYKYAETFRFLIESFGHQWLLYKWDGATPQISVDAVGLYDEFVSKYYGSRYDFIVFPGVLYHLTDPILALRIIFNCLKDGGKVFIETAISQACNDHSFCKCHFIEYRGPSKTGWSWFIPSTLALTLMLQDVGFENVRIEQKGVRAYAVATRREHKDMLRAGLSRRDVR
jgi:2-polyprenyl-3-methyl-5-hydroxy-6-metoxy-1,4-benzoquinol methylase